MEAYTTYKVILVQKVKDLEYINYVFKCLEGSYNNSKYIMCTQFPNWDQKNIDIDDIGYLKILEIKAGVTKWYDGNEFIPYKYDNIQLLKFIHEKTKEENSFSI